MTTEPFDPSETAPTNRGRTHDPSNPGEICPHGYKHPSPFPCPECGYAPQSAIEALVYQIEGDAYRIAQRSPHEGAMFAWERLDGQGVWRVVGCLCHTTPSGREGTLSRTPQTQWPDQVLITRNEAGSIVVQSRAGDSIFTRREDVIQAVLDHIKAVL